MGVHRWSLFYEGCPATRVEALLISFNHGQVVPSAAYTVGQRDAYPSTVERVLKH